MILFHSIDSLGQIPRSGIWVWTFVWHPKCTIKLLLKQNYIERFCHQLWLAVSGHKVTSSSFWIAVGHKHKTAIKKNLYCIAIHIRHSRSFSFCEFNQWKLCFIIIYHLCISREYWNEFPIFYNYFSVLAEVSTYIIYQ
jgi:hypothetical protein